MKSLIFCACIGIFVLLLLSFPSTETYVKTTPIVKVEVTTKKIVKKHHYVKRKYTPPEGKALAIAEHVAKETGYSVDTISHIMWAESGYNPKAKHINKNGSYDSGLFQINSQHFPLAESMGINLLTDEGNAEFAIYLIHKNGLRDWSFSQKDWQT